MKLRNINSIHYFSFARSDFHIMEPMLKKISLTKKIKVNIVITGTHGKGKSGNIKKFKSINYSYINQCYIVIITYGMYNQTNQETDFILNIIIFEFMV